MRSFLLFFIFFNIYVVNCQNINNYTIFPINCQNDTGSIVLDINNVDQLELNWYFQDNFFGWISADTIFNIDTQLEDTLYTQKCGNFKLEIFDLLTSVFLDSVIFFVGCELGRNPSQSNVKCHGNSDGIIKIVAHSGSPPYMYNWFSNNIIFSSGFNDTIQNNLDTGLYLVVIEDAINCTDTMITNISQPMQIQVELYDTIGINCRDQYQGSMSIAVRGGRKHSSSNKYFYYLFLDNDTIAYSDLSGNTSNYSNISTSLSTQSSLFDSIRFDSLASGQYIFHVIDDNECIMSDTILLTQPDPYEVFISSEHALICESDSGFFYIDSILGGGSINYGFVYNNSDSIFASSGWYDIYINELTYQCYDTVEVRFSAQYEISVFSTIVNPVCYGYNTGQIFIDSIIGGNQPYDIQWGGINPNALSADLYRVLFVDGIGCVHEELFLINEPSFFDANATLSSPSCFGYSNGSIVINPVGGTGFINYNWINLNSSSDTLTNLFSDNYYLSIYDSLNCTDTIEIFLNQPEYLSFMFDNFDSLLDCLGSFTSVNLLISGGVGPYNISWDDGTSDIQKILNAGTYYCEISDLNSCAFTDTLNIEEPDSLNISITFNYLPCDSSGSSATVDVIGGIEPISFFWSTGDTTSNIDSLFGDIYWVIATDSCGNSDSVGYTVAPYFLETIINSDSSLPNSFFASVLNPSSASQFSFQWQDVFGNVISNDSISGTLCQNTYFLTVTDLSNGCFLNDTLNVVYDLPFGILDLSTVTIFEDNALWGNPPFSYFWDDGSVEQHAELCSGSHWVEVTDFSGCMIRQDFNIEELVITLDPVSAIIECDIQNLDVDIEVKASGGTSPYSFQWSNGSTEEVINLQLDPGNYSVSVIDYNKCIVDTTFIIATMSSDCIPNVFSPNNDNINDTWNLEDTFLFYDTEIKIYGRYGRLVFESIGYTSPWDGKNFRGNDVPDGVYFYHIELGHGFNPIYGTVTVVR